jgi:hypothetical protein
MVVVVLVVDVLEVEVVLLDVLVPTRVVVVVLLGPGGDDVVLLVESALLCSSLHALMVTASAPMVSTARSRRRVVMREVCQPKRRSADQRVRFMPTFNKL